MVAEEYVYDGDGNRIKKTDSSSEGVYICSGMNVLCEVNTTTQMDAVYIYGPSGRIAKKVNDIAEFYRADHLGSTRLITTENGVVTEEIQYQPFGEEMNTSEERYTYNGKERDQTGLYYYGARYYDPVIGRFISRDPLAGEKESPQTLNRYVYCLNNPLSYVDPAGTEGKSAYDLVEEVFSRVQGLDPNEMAKVQELLNAGKQFEALKMMLELLGFEFTDNGDGTLCVNIGDDKWYHMKIDNDLMVEGQTAWGATYHDIGSISINFTSGIAGDIALTILHEVCHGLLGGTTDQQISIEHKYIYGVEYSYMVALNNLGIRFSSGPGLAPNFVQHLNNLVSQYDPEGKFQPPVLTVIRTLRERWKKC